MAPEALGVLIGASATGISGVILAISGYRRTRAAQLREDLAECWQEQRATRERLRGALNHLTALENLLAAHRIEVPPRPASLDPGSTAAPPDAWQPQHAAV